MHMQFLKSLVMFVPVRYKYDASIAICLYTCRNLLVLINTKLTDLWFMFFLWQFIGHYKCICISLTVRIQVLVFK